MNIDANLAARSNIVARENVRIRPGIRRVLARLVAQRKWCDDAQRAVDQPGTVGFVALDEEGVDGGFLDAWRCGGVGSES